MQYSFIEAEYVDEAVKLKVLCCQALKKPCLAMSFYEFNELAEGGSHVSVFTRQMKALHKQLKEKSETYSNQWTHYHFMIHVETTEPLCYLGPTKSRIEDPILVRAMKGAFVQLKEKIEQEFLEHTG